MPRRTTHVLTYSETEAIYGLAAEKVGGTGQHEMRSKCRKHILSPFRVRTSNSLILSQPCSAYRPIRL
jgi:hypothetical protein